MRPVVEQRFHCTVCDDFDLCSDCFNKDGHEHEMDKYRNHDLAESSSTADPGKALSSCVKRCADSLVHACHCCDSSCRLPSCHKMKHVLKHWRLCHISNADCPICKQFIALVTWHLKRCRQSTCLVPNCASVRTNCANAVVNVVPRK